MIGDDEAADASVQRSARVDAVAHGVMLGIACTGAYLLETALLREVLSVSTTNELLGGMWAAVATVFVYRDTYEEGFAAVWVRAGATLTSCVVCLAYLLVLPFSAWGLGVTLAVGAIAVTLLGHPDEAVTTGITTSVVMVVAGLGPDDEGWQQPLFRVLDTAVGLLVGLVVVWLTLRVLRRSGGALGS